MGAPFLHTVTSLPEKIDQTTYPFNIPAFSRGIDLTFRSKVTLSWDEALSHHPRLPQLTGEILQASLRHDGR
jgi:hypothetical protein